MNNTSYATHAIQYLPKTFNFDSRTSSNAQSLESYLIQREFPVCEGGVKTGSCEAGRAGLGINRGPTPVKAGESI
jgi:hypothetical protein